MKNYVDQASETVDFLKQLFPEKPKWAMILGSGLGNLTEEMTGKTVISYSEVPHFPTSTVSGHAGNLVFGYWANIPVLVMQGRLHYYEGYTMQEVTFPVRVFGEWEIKNLLVSNAAGGLSPTHELGEVMWISDHINMMGTNPLIGKNHQKWGERFPDMSEVYRQDWIEKALTCSALHGQKSSKGIFMAVSGPTFETPAEYQAFRALGADAVGMSTVPEAIVAHHMGMHLLGFSVISDLGVPGKIEKIDHLTVLQSVKMAEAKLRLIVADLLQNL
jgi:purine-nucleoside phosphorylase